MLSGPSLTVACMSSQTVEASAVDQDRRATQAQLGARGRSESPIDNPAAGSTRWRVATACAGFLVAAVVVGMQQSPPAQIMAPGSEPALHLQASGVDSHRLVVPNAQGR